MDNISTETISEYQQLAMEYLTLYGSKVLLAIITLIIGLWIIKWVVAGMNKALQRAKVEQTLLIFLDKLVSTLLKVLLLISVAGMIGIQTASFIAIFAAAGLAIGLALQGSLANFAGGVLILLIKPFRVGDYIETEGHGGTVKEIQIFNTILLTPDRKTIIIPNGPISNGSITNYSTSPTRRVAWVFGIGYDDDLKKAKSILERLVAEDDRILQEEDNQVLLSELGDNSVNFTVRAFVNSPDFWAVYFDMFEKVKLTFDAEGISIPYPQRDVHLYPVDKAS